MDVQRNTEKDWKICKRTKKRYNKAKHSIRSVMLKRNIGQNFLV